MIFSLVVSKKLRTRGRKNAAMIGLCVICGMDLLFIACILVKKYSGFLSFFCIVRALQGMGQAFVITAVNSMMIINYSDSSDDYIGLTASANGLGIIIGPLISSSLFQPWKFKGVYLGSSFIFAVWVVIFMVVVPNSLNKNEKKDLRVRFDSRYSFQSIAIENSNFDQSQSSRMSNSLQQDVFDSIMKNYQEPTMKMFFRYREIVFLFIGSTVSLILLGFAEDILVQVLVTTSVQTARNFCSGQHFCWTIPEYYLIPVGSFILGTPCVFFLTKTMQRKLVIFFGFILVAAFLLVQGPSNLFTIDITSSENDVIQNFRIAGLFMSGFFLAFLFFPMLPEIVCVAQQKESLLEDYSLIDKASGLYGVFFSLGNILAVIISDVLFYKAFTSNFRSTCDAMALLSVTFALIFLFTNVGLAPFKEKPHRDADPMYEKVMKEFLRAQSQVEPFTLEGKQTTMAPMFVLDKGNMNYGQSDQQSNEPLLDGNEDYQAKSMQQNKNSSLNAGHESGDME